MPRFGAHLSVSGGLHHAITSATALGCEAVQIFTKNASQWAAPPLGGERVAQFRQARAAADLACVAVHDSYLINLASPDDTAFTKSLDAFVDEMERAEAIGAEYLVTHPGSHLGAGEEAGLARVAAGLDEAHRRCAGFRVRVLLETTAGTGTTLGHRFEHLATLLSGTSCADRLGVCFDTCHVFAAGYPLATADEYDATVQEFGAVVGFDRLKLFHLNDSAKARGSRIDRHAGIGRGAIGADAFRRLVTDPRFADVPMILETPKKGDGGADLDAVNLALLRGFATGAG